MTLINKYIKGNNRNHAGYYAYGLPVQGSEVKDPDPYLYGSKEFYSLKGVNLYDFNARTYAPDIARFLQPDPKADDYPWLSPYSYCGGDPINNIDPDGKSWFRTNSITYDPLREEFEIKEVIGYTPIDNATDFYKQNTDPGAEYLGEIVVVFDGSYDEKLASDGTIDGEGAINADVTVYGPRGENDIDSYIGFTMTSDFNMFGAIDNGEYDVMYDAQGKSGKLKSHYAVNGRKPVNCLNGVNPSPPAHHPYSSTQKDGVFVHGTNLNGYAGYNKKSDKAVSTGCPLIHGAQWGRFTQQIGRSGFNMIINRR